LNGLRSCVVSYTLREIQVGHKNSMTRFLFTTLPTNDLGLLARSLPIARELAAHAHTVLFCNPASAPRHLIAEAGFENLTLNHPIFDLIATDRSLRGLLRFIGERKYRPRYGSLTNFLRRLLPALPIKSAPDTSEVWNMDHAGAMMGMLNEGFVRANCEALRELMLECRAEVVVDFWNPFAVIAARSLRKPVVTVIQANAHPASQGFIWWKTPPPDTPSPVPVVNKVLADYDLPRIQSISDLGVGDLTLAVGTPETDPLPDGAGVTYIGPALWQKDNAQLPRWIIGLETDRPLIWLYSGNPRYSTSRSTLDSIVIVHACIAALADEDVQVVLTTGHHQLPEEVQPLPANFRHEAYVPGLAMAECSDLLIHHGGYGSCQTGLYAGKPAVILPTYSERESNARRIAALGAGAIVPVETLSGEKHVRIDELRTTVRRVLGDPTFADNARRLSERLRAYGGPAYAARLIEQFGQASSIN